MVAVALRKESVDRNTGVPAHRKTVQGSLSARRAWIEIDTSDVEAATGLSLSARRAWIEIGLFGADTVSHQRRSPQGERG